MELLHNYASTICFVEECLEDQVHLVDCQLPRVKFIEGKHVGSDENVDSSGNDLVVGIRDLPNALDLLALFNAVE
jgi:hypothetical protein